jgi:hypothetical protein
MSNPENPLGDGAWRSIERLLPTPDVLPQKLEDSDTELHWMPGPAQPLAKCVVDSWKRAVEARHAHTDRDEIRIPGVPQRRILQSRPPRKKAASFRDVVGDEGTDKFNEDAKRAREDAHERRMKDPAYQRMLHRLTYRLR